MRVPSMARTKVSADAQRSLWLIFSSCFFGPTRKQVAASADTLPSVNMKMNEDLQAGHGGRVHACHEQAPVYPYLATAQHCSGGPATCQDTDGM